MNTKLSVHVIADTPGGAPFCATLLEYTTRILREKKVNGEDATEEELDGLEGIRLLLMRVEAVHAVSWLWYTGPAPIAREGTRKSSNTTSPPVRTMMPILGHRAARPGVVLRSMFR